MRHINKFMLLVLILCSCTGKTEQNKLFNQDAVSLTNKAVECTCAFKYDSALIYLDKAIMIDSTLYNAYGVRVSVYMSQKKYDKALKAAEKQIQLKPDLVEAYTTAGTLNDMLNDSIKAKEYYSDALKLYDKKIKNTDKPIKQVTYKINRIFLLIMLGKENEAKKQIAEVEAEKPINHASIEMLKKMTRKSYLETCKK